MIGNSLWARDTCPGMQGREIIPDLARAAVLTFRKRADGFVHEERAFSYVPVERDPKLFNRVSRMVQEDDRWILRVGLLPTRLHGVKPNLRWLEGQQEVIGNLTHHKPVPLFGDDEKRLLARRMLL